MPDTSLLSTAGRVALALALRPDARPADLADDLGLSERAVRRALAGLVEAGHVERTSSARAARFRVRPDLARALQDPALRDGPPTPAGTTKSERRVVLEVKLLKAIEDLFARGERFAEISVERLIGEAGIGRATFYAHFADKDSLLVALTEGMIEAAWTSSPFWGDPSGTERTPAALREAVESTAVAYRSRRGIMAAVADALAPGSRLRDDFQRVFEASAESMAEHIARPGAGAHHPDVDAPAAAALLTWTGERALHKLADAEGEVSSRTLDALADLLWHATYAPR